jgi:hypothetical protein
LESSAKIPLNTALPLLDWVFIVDYGQVLNFSFAWLSKRETLKYAVLLWAVTVFFSLLFIAGFFFFFWGIISSFLASPLLFLSELMLNPLGFLVRFLPSILLFVLFAVAVSIASYFVTLYISALLYFFAFKNAKLGHAAFPPQRTVGLFVLQVAGLFLVLFSWVHRKAWLLLGLLPLGLLFMVFGLVNPLFYTLGSLLFLAAVAGFIVFPLYLFFADERQQGAVIVNKYFLLFAPAFFALLLLLGFLRGVPALLTLALLLLLLLVYAGIIVHNWVRLWFSTPVFVQKGASIFDSLRGSIALTQGRTLNVILALLIGGIVGGIVFYVASAVLALLFSLIFFGVIPSDLWGFSAFLASLSALPQFSAAPLQSQIKVARMAIARAVGESISQVLVTPFSMLFSVFLTVGIYLNLIQSEGGE